MGSLGPKYFTMEMVTASASLSNCQRSHGGAFGSFFYILKDSGGTNTTNESIVTDSRITYTFPSSFSIDQMKFSSNSSNVSTGNLYVILAPNDDNVEFIHHIPLSLLDRETQTLKFDPAIFIEDVTDKLNLRFVFKGHPTGAQFKYWVSISGEEFERDKQH